MRSALSLTLLHTALRLVVTLAPAACITLVGSALTSSAIAADGPYWATVTGDNVMIRSGPSSSSHYPIGRAQAGQPLKVLSVEYGWAKVAAIGPSFAGTTAYIKAEPNVTFNQSAKTISVQAPTKLLAANMDSAFDPSKSWRTMSPDLAAGDTLAVVEVKQAGNDTYYAVRLPVKTEAFVNQQFIRDMTQAEADAMEASLGGGAAAPVAKPPVVTPPTATPPAKPTAAPSAAPNVTPPAAPATPTTDGTTPAGTVTNNPPAVPDAAAEEAAQRAAQAKADADALAEATRREAMERQIRQVTFSDLESIWAKVRNEAAEGAELDALRERYLALANDPLTQRGARDQANARADQIAMRVEVQRQLMELVMMRARLNERKQGVADLELAMLKRKPYDAVGRLNASTVYNGDRLPLLYKLTDSGTGFTIAYVMPGPTTKPSEALGLVVGIKGKRQYNEALRLNVITPDIIEVLDTTLTATTLQ